MQLNEPNSSAARIMFRVDSIGLALTSVETDRPIDTAVNGLYTFHMADEEPHAMDAVRTRFKESGLSLHDLGMKMGFAPETARQAAHQFLKANDPRLSSLRRFARALDIPISELIENKQKRAK